MSQSSGSENYYNENLRLRNITFCTFPWIFVIIWNVLLTSCFQTVQHSLGLCIWHKSARMGEILNICHYFDISSTLVYPEWFLCRGHIAVQGHKCWRQSKSFVYINWPHLDDQVEAFQVGVIPGIFNFEVGLTLIRTFSTFVTTFV